MLSEYERLGEKIALLQSQLQDLPEGKLICSNNQGYKKWYQSDGHTKTYIPRKERFFAEQLAAKKFLLLQIEDLTAERKAIRYYLEYHCAHPEKASQLLSEDSRYKELLTSFFKPCSENLTDWMNSSYQKNPNYPEQLIHKSISGNLVRSKSEAFIDMVLHTNKIPFRYECALQLGEITIFPDFTIRHPVTGETFYWEHFGLMDQASYIQKTFSKLELYASHGIIPSVNLLTTYETKENPLSMDMLEKIVHHYFL